MQKAKTAAEAGCCYAISAKRMSTIAGSVTYACSNIESGLKSGEFEAISQQLQALLKENPLSLQEIKDKMQVPENHLMKVVSYLVSEEIIRQENGYLEF